MKSIEQKLKLDAKAFKQNPADIVYDNIMQSIESIKEKQSRTSIKSFNWLMPTGLAIAALLVVMMNIIPMNQHDKIIANPQQNKILVKLPQVDVQALSISLGSSFISGITAEKKALQADLIYMKTIFSL